MADNDLDKRRDAVQERMLNTPHKPHKPVKGERGAVRNPPEKVDKAERGIALLAQGDTSEEAKEHKTLVYAALFRPTVDGIIKEDGGVDPALSAALSKFLMK